MKAHWTKLKAIATAPYRRVWWRRVMAWTVTLVVAFFLLLGAVDINFLWLFGRSPGFSDIARPPVTEASIIFSADSVQLGSFYSENRIPVTYDEISPIVVRTLISTEDVRFYKHHGVDFAGLFSAIRDILEGNTRGASTITQQLAKNLFKVRRADGQYSTGLLGNIPGARLLIVKAKEWIVAIKLEMLYSKEDIITMYLNTVDFGCNAYGIKTACSTYFDTTPHHLSYEQAATLVGLLKATSTYNPKLHPGKSQERRNVVLDNLFKNRQMVLNGYHATQGQLDSIKAIPLTLTDNTNNRENLGIVPYFRNALGDYVDMLCEKGCIPGYDAEDRIDLYRSGLKIYTTLDTRIQRYAEDAVRKQMRIVQRNFDSHWTALHPWQDTRGTEIPAFIKSIAKHTATYKYLAGKYGENSDSVDYYLRLPHPVTVFTYDGREERELSVVDSIRYMVCFMHCGFVAIEPDTREVKAWVGDIDFNSWQYDKVISRRQPGSTFKLFVYTEAMNQGLTPCDRRMDVCVSYPDGRGRYWTPHNADGGYWGADVTLKRAFAQSVNSVAVRLGKELGMGNVIRTAHAMGIESRLDENLSLSLGTNDVSLLEMVNSYCTVADGGKYNMPIMITRIEDRDGHVIYKSELHKEPAIPYRSAYLMQKMLRGGLEPGGTSAGLWAYIHPILNTGTEFGGKTGTTNNYSDAWYMGVTPGLVAGAWVGGEYRGIHFRSGALGQGSRTAMPIFGYFIQNLLKDKRFSKYHRKFDVTPEEDINAKCWTCDGFYSSPDTFSYKSPAFGDSTRTNGITVFRSETITEAEASDD